MKKNLKFVALAVIIIVVSAQFFRPAKNNSNDQARHFSTLYPLPDSVESILKVACYDCHSNNTRYPWYAEIQPVGWWLNDHIRHGKKDLNFSEFASYRIRRQYRKLQEIGELVEENAMPLPDYLRMHNDAILTQRQKETFYAWVKATRDTIAVHTPADSLKQPPRRQ
jgi:hypothetical protein